MKIPEEANQRSDMEGENLQMTTLDREDIRDVELLLVETGLMLCRQQYVLGRHRERVSAPALAECWL